MRLEGETFVCVRGFPVHAHFHLTTRRYRVTCIKESYGLAFRACSWHFYRELDMRVNGIQMAVKNSDSIIKKREDLT